MKPFIVEFTGTPEAGKTTSIKQIIPILESDYQMKITYIRESAEVTPSVIPKGSFAANFWMRTHTFQNLLESIYDNPNGLIIVDRGLIDGQLFNRIFYLEGKCTVDEFKSLRALVSYKDLFPDLLIHLKTTPEESIRRRGGEGRIVTLNWVKNYNHFFDEFLSSVSVPVFTLDTTDLPQDKVIELIVKEIITHYNNNYKNIQQ